MISSIEELYKILKEDNNEEKAYAEHSLLSRSWFFEICEFDPLTGESLFCDLDNFLIKILQNKNPLFKDHFYRLTEHCKEAISHLIKEMQEKIVREHEVMPIYRVREIDSNTVIWISNKPGRNIKQKLSYAHGNIKAVKRRISFNTMENRLLKYMSNRLKELFQEREEIFEENYFEELLAQLVIYLRSEEINEIGAWTNERPNNVLLSNKRYKKILNSYNFLKTIDDDIKYDFEKRYRHLLVVVYWNIVAKFYQIDGAKFLQMPVLIDYQKFEIETFCEIEGIIGNKKIKFQLNKDNFTINFNNKYLNITCDNRGLWLGNSRSLLWSQFFYYSTESGLKLFTEDIFKFFFNKNVKFRDKNVENLENTDIAVIDICKTIPNFWYKEDVKKLPFNLLRQIWERDGKIYAIDCSKSDDLRDDVKTDSIESILTKGKDENNSIIFFAQKIKEYIPSEKMIYLLPDSASDFATSEIRKSMNFCFTEAEPLPKSIAFAFSKYKELKVDDELYVIDVYENTYSETKIKVTYNEETKRNVLERYPTKIRENLTVNLNIEDALKGAKILNELQAKAENIPLWYDHLPELSIKIPNDRGFFVNFYLVKKVRISPQLGKKIEIKINENFILPANKEFYTFPLIQGEEDSNLNYDIYLKPKFPLKQETKCELKLTYAYGEENPYELIFIPLDSSIQPIKAEWHLHKEIDLDKLPVPNFPPIKSWEDLRKNPNDKPDSNTGIIGTTDLLVEFPKSFGRSLLNKNFQKSKGFLKYCAITIWKAHSLSEKDCPEDFSQKMSFLTNKNIEDKDSLLIFAYMNDDAPPEAINYLNEKIQKREIATKNGNQEYFENTRAIAYSIGSCKFEWQQNLLKQTISFIEDKQHSETAFFILSVILWRNENAIEFINKESLEKILKRLDEKLGSKIIYNNNYLYWHLETFFSLVRLRNSEQREIKKLLSPDNPTIKRCIDNIDKITKFIVENKLEPISYLIFDETNKSSQFRDIPDLLYALRMYLSGDDGANSISITGLNERQ